MISYIPGIVVTVSLLYTGYINTKLEVFVCVFFIFVTWHILFRSAPIGTGRPSHAIMKQRVTEFKNEAGNAVRLAINFQTDIDGITYVCVKDENPHETVEHEWTKNLFTVCTCGPW